MRAAGAINGLRLPTSGLTLGLSWCTLDAGSNPRRMSGEILNAVFFNHDGYRFYGVVGQAPGPKSDERLQAVFLANACSRGTRFSDHRGTDWRGGGLF